MSAAVVEFPQDVAVVGWACRFPGAASVEQLWSVLRDGRCVVRQVPADRFPLGHFGHPRRQERGRSYTWAAGVLDRIWDFDPSVFGISPREAVQMDPQQRLLLQLTWEALEDAGIPPSSLAGADVGVYVGACQVEYGHRLGIDHAVADSHFATGTALSIAANRISYSFDLRGPSMTIDTACSSSMVALHEAVQALRSGRVDTAIVGGVNLIESPSSFVAFSQASMLSPTGACRAFSAKADGFVRAEGAGVLVLQHTGRADLSKRPVHGYVVATDVNSDGRKSGISLPSLAGQEALLNRIYGAGNVDPRQLAFVEAHGTGTPVGDPIEAAALGRALGERRDRAHPLLIGSIKTNIGHLEAAAGMAGLFKTLLALNHGELPASLGFAEPNPHIDFDELNLSVCATRRRLPPVGSTIAGVNSFGFGGTNAHAIVARGRTPQAEKSEEPRSSSLFLISAETKAALASLAGDYAQRCAGLSDEQIQRTAAAAAHRRDALAERAIVTSSRKEDVLRALEACAVQADAPHLLVGQALGRNLPVAFVYSGNGSQWPGMGRGAFRDGTRFARHFDLLDSHFEPLAGWSLRKKLFSEDLASELQRTNVAQPLLFAIQSATTVELSARGLMPAVVLGHSVGEVAAAEAAGILSPRSAIELIYFRSLHQQRSQGLGGMAAVRAPVDVVESLVLEIPDLQIAAINSPRTVTVAGTRRSLETLKAKFPRIPVVDLGLEYPFHTRWMDGIRHELLADLGAIVPGPAQTRFVSSVTGGVVAGTELGAEYWWRNVREPVKFASAIRTAGELGARVYVEIGPRPNLLQHIGDVFEGGGSQEISAFAVLHQDQKLEAEPFGTAVARAAVTGARLDLSLAFGEDPGPATELPSYPWQNKEYRFQHTVEAVGGNAIHVPLIGMRYMTEGTEWYSNVDTALYPEFRDHRVGQRVILPGTAFIEIALSAGRQWLQGQHPVLSEFEIMQPLDLTRESTYEIRTRISPASGTLEIASRPRLSPSSWTLHARCKLSHGHGQPPVVPRFAATERIVSAAELYASVSGGLDYGPQFQAVDRVIVCRDDLFDVRLKGGREATQYVLDPVLSDCCGHGILPLFEELKARERGVTYIPVRCDRISIYKAYATPSRAVIKVLAKGLRAIKADYYILDSNDELIAHLGGVRGQALPVRRQTPLTSMAFVEVPRLVDGVITGHRGVAASIDDVVAAATAGRYLGGAAGKVDKYTMLFDQLVAALAYELFGQKKTRDGAVDFGALARSESTPPGVRHWLLTLTRHLEGAGMAKATDTTLRLTGKRPARSPHQILRMLYRDCPERPAELVLAGWLSGLMARILENGLPPPGELRPPDSATDFYSLTSAAAQDAESMVVELLRRCEAIWPQGRALQVLVVGYGAVARELATGPYRGSVRVTVYEPNRRLYDRAQAARSPECRFALLDGDDLGAGQSYDLVVAAHSLRGLSSSTLQQLHEVLTPGGLLLAVEPQPSVFADLLLAAHTSGDTGHPRALRQGDEWVSDLQAAGLRHTRVASARGRSGSHLLIVGKAATHVMPAKRPATPRSVALVACSAAGPLQPALARCLERDAGVDLRLANNLTESDLPRGTTIVHLGEPTLTGDAQEDLLRRCRQLQAVVEGGSSTARVHWLVFSGALSIEGSIPSPVETAAWAFSRVLANEHPKLDIRRIDIRPDTPTGLAAEHIASIVSSATAETELHSDGRSIRAVRVVQLGPEAGSPSARRNQLVQLSRSTSTAQRLAWLHKPRGKPERDEVEIAVDYAALNFRDLMLSLGLLPDEMVEDGFAGPALGLECSGRIVKVGPGVKQFRVGDRVVALAANCIATHIVARTSQVAKRPRTVGPAAAATIPVAFMTAYYSLIKLAELESDETVLIHGGAGAVGLAAIQIAKWRGARVIATAGSVAKRDLLLALGVDHVLDSRTTTFAEEVAKLTGSGVDVVLNSLAGEAMEASIACLRPFGRFVELGKRDFVVNTNVGLRPFRRNLSYFGVDLDQLVVGRPGQAKAVFKELMALFEKGALQPLPFSTFQGEAVGDAFKLMQESLHVGKIVVVPPDVARIPFASSTGRRLSTTGTHVITGGFGGFGMEAARWLVDQGVRHLALFGRHGAASPNARALVEDLERRGVKVMADPVDVSDADAVGAAFARLRDTMPPVVGVMHAAMVLEDGLTANLGDDEFRRVFAPKIRGAENLDIATRGLALDYFVLFSSITTIAGHHGQGNYVAANAYMEGFARKRRLSGKPTVAVAWGVISDVGVAALNEKARKSLAKLAAKKGMNEEDALAMIGMRARDALEVLGQILEREPDSNDPPVLIISPSGTRLRKEYLPILKSPTYEDFVQEESGGQSTEVDLAALLQTEDIKVVRAKVTTMVTEQLARVLHTRPDDISQSRPLRELGLDSLMTLELAMDLEGSIGLDFSLSQSVGGMTIPALVDEILARAAASQGTEPREEEANPTDASVDTQEPVALEESLKNQNTRLVA